MLQLLQEAYKLSAGKTHVQLFPSSDNLNLLYHEHIRPDYDLSIQL